MSCQRCGARPAEVVLDLDGDEVTRESRCMDCAAPAVASYMALVVEVLPRLDPPND